MTSQPYSQQPPHGSAGSSSSSTCPTAPANHAQPSRVQRTTSNIPSSETAVSQADGTA